MKTLLLLALLAVFSTNSGLLLAAGAEKLVLSLEVLEDEKPIHSVQVYSSQIDPNVSGVGDTVHLEIDGKTVKAPEGLLSKLSVNRRTYSYDSLSGGIVLGKMVSTCRLGGPALGVVLKTRYLTFKNYAIVHDEMKPVYSEQRNCLFSPDRYWPKDNSAQKDAIRAVAILETIKELY